MPNLEQKNTTTPGGVLVNLQITQFFISKCGVQAILKPQNLVNLKHLLEKPWSEKEASNIFYLVPREKLVVVERENFH